MVDYFTEAGAAELANKIKASWMKRGYSINTRVEKTMNPKNTETLFVVRSDMINGLPISHARQLLAA